MNLKGLLFALLGFAIYAAHDVVVKYVGETITPFQIIFFASLISFPFVTVIQMRDPEPQSLRPVHPWWVLIRVVTMLGAGLFAFIAFILLPLAQTYTLLFAAPLLITVLSIPLLSERVGVHRWGAVVVGLIGVIVVLRPAGGELGFGHLAGLLSALCNAVTSIAVRRIGHAERSVVLLLYPLLGNVILMGIALPFVYVPMPLLEFGGLVVIAGFGLLAAFCMILAYRYAEAAIVAPMQYSQILWATFYGYLLFDERLDGPTAVGAGLIIASGLYIVYREGQTGVSQNTPVLRNRSRGWFPAGIRVSVWQRLKQR